MLINWLSNHRQVHGGGNQPPPFQDTNICRSSIPLLIISCCLHAVGNLHYKCNIVLFEGEWQEGSLYICLAQMQFYFSIFCLLWLKPQTENPWVRKGGCINIFFYTSKVAINTFKRKNHKLEEGSCHSQRDPEINIQKTRFIEVKLPMYNFWPAKWQFHMLTKNFFPNQYEKDNSPKKEENLQRLCI